MRRGPRTLGRPLTRLEAEDDARFFPGASSLSWHSHAQLPSVAESFPAGVVSTAGLVRPPSRTRSLGPTAILPLDDIAWRRASAAARPEPAPADPATGVRTRARGLVSATWGSRTTLSTETGLGSGVAGGAVRASVSPRVRSGAAEVMAAFPALDKAWRLASARARPLPPAVRLCSLMTSPVCSDPESGNWNRKGAKDAKRDKDSSHAHSSPAW
ncbi:hypothetical protein D779_1740 [Imhoffiella purpurea]|uniref:Uncharacterized protein n=1 Tax=Imhoffiella purpurea TaxID=1249627 RepID=W9VDW5_9GAMM|nr:hypothetical protein D779_1740 [Imhoffiella purpurea]